MLHRCLTTRDLGETPSVIIHPLDVKTSSTGLRGMDGFLTLQCKTELLINVASQTEYMAWYSKQSTPSKIQYTWRQQITIVAKAGYGAVAPDYTGFRLIDIPVEHDQIFFVDLVKDTGSILDHLNISKQLAQQNQLFSQVYRGREWRSKTTPALAMVTMLAIMISIISRNADIFSEIAIFGSVEGLYGFVVKMLKTKSAYVAWRRQLAIKGVFINGDWVEDPTRVKREFYDHFSRNILDGPIIIDEIIAWYRKHKKNLMVFKVDFEKAFDSLRWDYLDLIMSKFEFDIQRGLRQGDPLSPFLFILAMEGLHVLSRKAESLGLFKGVSIGYEADIEVSNLANHIGCAAASTPFKYLGVPVGGNMNSLHVYYLSIYKMPVAVQHKLASLRSKFFIGGDLDARKMSWVRWNKCLGSKEKGGLGIGSLYGLNIGLLFKWIWRFLYSPSDLWVKVIKFFHGDRGRISDGSSSIRNSTWGNILSAVGKLKSKGIDLFALCSRKLGDGKECKFWEDSWCGSGFSVASARNHIDALTLDVSSSVTRWNKAIPIKINVFLWRLLLNKLATRINLDRRGIDLDSTLCPLCMEDVETANHLFFSCDIASALWNKFASWWQLDIPMCANIGDWYGWLDSLQYSNKSKAFIAGAGSTLLWCIWKFRNDFSFPSIPLGSLLFGIQFYLYLFVGSLLGILFVLKLPENSVEVLKILENKL
nr:hypothetical protein [Tanacetum cinerariifolium]